MKNHAAVIAILMLAGLTGLVSAQAIRPRIMANVPFEFDSNGKTMPAGECVITLQGDGAPILLIRSGNENLLAIPQTTESTRASGKTTLVFHQYGDRYFLASISLEGRTRGYEFPARKLEAELRSQKVTERDVILLASLHSR